MYVIGISRNKTQYSTMCAEGVDIANVEISLHPYLEPVLLEYSLLSLIFLSKMWPKHSVGRTNESSTIYSSIEKSENCRIDGENTVLLSNWHITSERIWNRKSCIVLFVSMFHSVSFIILQCVYIYVDDKRKGFYKSFLSVVFASANLARTPIIMRCFYALSNQLRPKHFEEN